MACMHSGFTHEKAIPNMSVRIFAAAISKLPMVIIFLIYGQVSVGNHQVVLCTSNNAPLANSHLCVSLSYFQNAGNANQALREPPKIK